MVNYLSYILMYSKPVMRGHLSDRDTFSVSLVTGFTVPALCRFAKFWPSL